MSELLKISGLWGGYKEGVDILQGIDMIVETGESVGIIGLNGSGKSTLGKAIMNMIPIRRGEILFQGEDVIGLSTCELARKGISFMQQGGQVFQNLSVWENLEMAFRFGMDDSFDHLREIISLLQEPKRKLQHQMADKLSGGQKHQLALAMALATQPQLVILDEPSAGLSPRAVEEMYAVLSAVREKMKVTIVLIEQNVARALSFCDRELLVRIGNITEVFCSSNIKEIEKVLFSE